MTGVINKHCLKSNFPNENIFSSEEFLGIPLDLKTGNNTKLNIEGVAFLDFSLKPMLKKVKVPFIVTNEYLENLIFGYDLTEHLSVSSDNLKIFDILMSVFPNISLEGAETMIPILQSIKRTIVLGNSTLRVKCRGNVEFDSKQKYVLFQPLLKPDISDILNINETCENLSKGKTPNIFITIANPSNKDIVINKTDILGTLHNPPYQLFIKNRSTLIRRQS